MPVRYLALATLVLLGCSSSGARGKRAVEEDLASVWSDGNGDATAGAVDASQGAPDLATVPSPLDLSEPPASPDLRSELSCVQNSPNQCSCFFAETNVPNVVTSCSKSQWTTGVCCTTADYASGTGACFCAPYGCTNAVASLANPCSCGFGSTGASTCSPTEGAICCRDENGPSCDCRAGRSSCPANSVQVSSCSASSPHCGASYTYPVDVSKCR